MFEKYMCLLLALVLAASATTSTKESIVKILVSRQSTNATTTAVSGSKNGDYECYCQQQTYCDSSARCDGAYCLKIKGKVSEPFSGDVDIKTCSNNDEQLGCQHLNVHDEYIDGDYYTFNVEYCACEGDLCNAASALKLPSMIVVALMIATSFRHMI